MLFGRNGKKFLENIYLSLPKNLSSLFAQWKISQAQYRKSNIQLETYARYITIFGAKFARF